MYPCSDDQAATSGYLPIAPSHPAPGKNPPFPQIDAFNFRALRNMNPHRAAIRLESIEPATVMRGTLPLDLGRLESDLPNFRIQILLNTGRIGLPAAELRFQVPALAGGSLIELRMAFEPGVHAP